jgi:hypothetical protein
MLNGSHQSQQCRFNSKSGAKLDKKLAIPIIMCKNLTIFPLFHFQAH